MKMPVVSALVAVAALAAPHFASAQGIVDPAGDLLPSYTGIHAGAVDVVSAAVTYDANAAVFRFAATVAGPIAAMPSAFYVWGFDRGQGTERFVSGTPSIGPGVRFDSVVLFRQDGSATVNRLVEGGSTAFSNAVSFSGNSFAGSIAASSLPSLGLAPAAYTWNLWPRDALVAATAGNAAISDFAPDASNAVVTAVPEPETYALLAFGLAVVGVARRRSRALR
jgi:hypothetical protein